MNLLKIIQYALFGENKKKEKDEKPIVTYRFDGKGSYKEGEAHKSIQELIRRVMETYPSPDPAFDPAQVYDKNGRLKDEYRKPTPTPTPSLPSMTPYEELSLETFKKYNVPPAVAYGIRNAEGGKINGFNLGAVDKNPKNAMAFESDLAESTAAAKLLSGQGNVELYGNRESGKQAFAEAIKRKTLDAILEGIRDAGYAGDPKTWKQRSIEQGRASGTRGAGEIYDTWDAFVKDTPAFKKWKNYR